MRCHSRARSSRRSSVWALVALLVALALAGCGRATAGGTGSGRPATATAAPTFGPTLTPTPCVYAQQWKPPAGNVQLDAIAMDAPGDGWAVGMMTGNPFGSGAAHEQFGVIYHLSGGQWVRLPQTYPGADISTISMDSPTDGWAASGPALTAQPYKALALHYTGGQWRPVDIPALDTVLRGQPGSSDNFITQISIQMFGPDAGWMFAYTNNQRDPKDPNSRALVVILRYERGSWTPIPIPSVKDTTELWALSAVSADEAWIAAEDYGDSAQTVLFAHFINGEWRIWPQTFAGGTQHIVMTSPTDGWAQRFDRPSDDTLLHFDGASWSPVTLPANWTRAGVEVFAPVYRTATGAVWLAGSDRAGAALLAQYANGQWSQVSWPFNDLLPGPMSLAADGSGDLWGVGDINHVLGCPPTLQVYVEQGVFFHETAAGWSKQVLP